jgi:hypothetical protein
MILTIGRHQIRIREFQAIVRAMALRKYPYIRWQGRAVLRLHIAAEAFLAGYFKMIQNCTLRADQNIPNKSDVLLVKRIAHLS